MSSSAATLTARRRTTIATASERCVCARASTICARVSGETQRINSKQGVERGQRRRRWIPTCLMSAPSSCSILMAHNDALHVDRRLFQHRWLSEHLRPMRSHERSRGSLERCWPCFHTTWRSAGHAAHAASLEFAKLDIVGKKKSEARRSVAASLVQAIWGRGRNARATHCTYATALGPLLGPLPLYHIPREYWAETESSVGSSSKAAWPARGRGAREGPGGWPDSLYAGVSP